MQAGGQLCVHLPQRNQAKDTAWRYLRRYAEPLLAKPPNESELRVDLVNGSMIRLYGADNPDALRGPYLDGVVLDEFADMKPEVWHEVVRPCCQTVGAGQPSSARPRAKMNFTGSTRTHGKTRRGSRVKFGWKYGDHYFPHDIKMRESRPGVVALGAGNQVRRL